MAHLRALRAWTEARLDPKMPDAVVRVLDDYARVRNPQASDFLNDLDGGQLARSMVRYGHLAIASNLAM